MSLYPYQQNKDIAQNDRRIGLNGLAGLGSTLAMLGLAYDSSEAISFAKELQQVCALEAYKASLDLAKEKGAFPNFTEDFTRMKFVEKICDVAGPIFESELAEHGLRNVALLTIPPVGTGSLLAGNISNGLEPIFSLEYDRRILNPDGSYTVEPVEDYAWKLYKENGYNLIEHLGVSRYKIVPEYFKTSRAIAPIKHVEMQAAIQEWVDGSISKTVNMPESFTLEEYNDLLMQAWRLGLKGVTTFREGTRLGVLVEKGESSTGSAKPEMADCPEPAKRERPRKLPAMVYQLPEQSGKNTYITIAHTEEDGTKKPWEMFIEAKGANSDWYTAVGLLASRIMRKTDDVAGVIKELKSVEGTSGYFTQEYGFVQSRPQHLGFILEEYIADLSGDDVKAPKDTGIKCEICGGSIIKTGGCTQCENGCIESYKCG